MPILTIKVSQSPSTALSQSIADTLLELTERILHKPAALTAVAIDYVAPENWFIAGKSLAACGKQSFHLDIKITDGTNTKSEKAQYIREAYSALSQLLGNVQEESYVYVHDVRADAYGYGGRTQEWRYVKSSN
jgi:4-oxalocrotonate tautomerase